MPECVEILRQLSSPRRGVLRVYSRRPSHVLVCVHDLAVGFVLPLVLRRPVKLTKRHKFDLGTCASLVRCGCSFLPLVDSRHIGLVRGRSLFILEPNGLQSVGPASARLL